MVPVQLRLSAKEPKTSTALASTQPRTIFMFLMQWIMFPDLPFTFIIQPPAQRNIVLTPALMQTDFTLSSYAFTHHFF